MLQDAAVEVESRVRKEERLVRADTEASLKSSNAARDKALSDLAAQVAAHHAHTKEHEVEVKRLQDQKLELHTQVCELKSKEAQYSATIHASSSRMEEALAEAAKAGERTKSLLNELKASREDTDRAKRYLTERDSLILRLKEELKARDEELDEAEEETKLKVTTFFEQANHAKMKELSLNINQILSSRLRRHSGRTKTYEIAG